MPDGHVPPEVDVLIAGSGAAGLTAALVAAVGGRRVLVGEASASLGGTTAVSGGRLWVPGNRFQDDPVRDREAAAAYLESVFDPAYRAMIDAFLESGPRMLDFVERHTPHRFVACPDYPDYLPDRPGVTAGGRCLDMRPYAGADPRVRVPYGYTPLTHAEWERWRFPDRYDATLLAQRNETGIATNGVALVSALVKGVEDAGGRIVTGHRLTRLDAIETTPRRSGSEIGGGGRWRATMETVGGPVTVTAGHVVLATGGYDQDPELRAAHLPHGIAVSAAGPANVGDGLRIARDLGAKVANLGEGWWMPMMAIPGEAYDGRPAYRSLIRERGLPRQIIVDADGHRFVNESAPYHEFCRVMLRRRTDRAFLIVDAGHRERYPLPGAPPGAAAEPGWLTRSPTLTGLAERLGIDPDGLAAQVSRWNEACAKGVDDEFHRGEAVYDRYHGAPDNPGNPNLGPLDTPPYYGVEVLAGTIGSKGGPVTDTDGRVLGRHDDRPIDGLYAAGNAAAFWTADGYPGPGATLGTGMTLAFRIGERCVR